MKNCLISNCPNQVSAKNLCQKHYKHDYYLKHKEKNLKAARKWCKDNPEKRKKSAREWGRRNKEKLAQYYQENKDKWKKYKAKRGKKKHNEYYTNRMQKDPKFKLICNLRKRLNDMLKSKKWLKHNKTKDILGCDLETFKTHLENQFQPNMNWENYGKWHVDHIIPLFSAKNYEELVLLYHYKNTQPLWASDNSKKVHSDRKYIKEKNQCKN